jgi:hypothetical protein
MDSPSGSRSGLRTSRSRSRLGTPPESLADMELTAFPPYTAQATPQPHGEDFVGGGADGKVPPTKASVALHEIVEQFAARVSKVGGRTLTSWCIRAENAVGGYQRGQDSLEPLNEGVSARITTTYTMGVGSPVTVALVVTTGNVVSVKRQ